MPPTAELGAGRFSPHVLEAIDRCLALYPEDRAQDCGELSELLGAQRESRHRNRPSTDARKIRSLTDSERSFARARKTSQRAWDKLERPSLPVLISVSIAAVLFGAIGVWTRMSPEGSSQPSDATVPPQGQPVGTIEEVRRRVSFEELLYFLDTQDGTLALGGIPADLEGVRRLLTAAEQGVGFAQYKLGIMYAEGWTVAEDDVEAVRWLRLAAEQGHGLAQYNLGIVYANGEGIPADPVESYAWYSVAESRSIEVLRNYSKESVSWRLSQSQVEEAQELSRKYWSLYVEPFQ